MVHTPFEFAYWFAFVVMNVTPPPLKEGVVQKGQVNTAVDQENSPHGDIAMPQLYSEPSEVEDHSMEESLNGARDIAMDDRQVDSHHEDLGVENVEHWSNGHDSGASVLCFLRSGVNAEDWDWDLTWPLFVGFPFLRRKGSHWALVLVKYGACVQCGTVGTTGSNEGCGDGYCNSL